MSLSKSFLSFAACLSVSFAFAADSDTLYLPGDLAMSVAGATEATGKISAKTISATSDISSGGGVIAKTISAGEEISTQKLSAVDVKAADVEASGDISSAKTISAYDILGIQTISTPTLSATNMSVTDMSAKNKISTKDLSATGEISGKVKYIYEFSKECKTTDCDLGVTESQGFCYLSETSATNQQSHTYKVYLKDGTSPRAWKLDVTGGKNSYAHAICIKWA